MYSQDLSVLIVSYNSHRLLPALLHLLKHELAPLNAEVLVVDNASHDGSAELVEKDFPWVRLLRSAHNLGFAAANNLAARAATGRHLLLLNPDALPEPGTIARGLTLMNSDAGVGLAGGQLRDEQGRIQPSARMFPSLPQEAIVLSGLAAKFPRSRWFGHLDRSWADPAKSAAVDWVPGAFALIRHDLFELLSGFDERFFLYYEEVDLCRRIQAAGYGVMYWPELRVRHIGGESARTVQGETVAKAGAQLTLWRARSGLLYYRKNHGWLAAWCVNRLERGWHALRALLALRKGQTEKAQESTLQQGLLARAWRDTLGGRVAPPRPW
ncbi:glycosyltransferase family 2 protein [Roseateles oligotrophus]|uniref:Glycosyltransferase family 2 protein n=1 Tax=Roseateles oligotrophus TaxID=1769250 RepID=A0ABT2YFP7_9BURK|nr:glycosyltransferase family 2 protein [Roseateles oligotrophus]MCV2368867.1 glycosyltransferase family 2 protein [Roseateles oligotrophus]